MTLSWWRMMTKRLAKLALLPGPRAWRLRLVPYTKAPTRGNRQRHTAAWVLPPPNPPLPHWSSDLLLCRTMLGSSWAGYLWRWWRNNSDSLSPSRHHRPPTTCWAASGPRRFSIGWRGVGDRKDRWQETKGKGLRIQGVLEGDMAARMRVRKRTGTAEVWGETPGAAGRQTGKTSTCG